MHVLVRLLVAFVLVAVPAARAAAQQRPLITEDPETIGAGRLLIETGLERGGKVLYPLSGLRGDRVGWPIGVSIGLGSIAELQLDTGYQWFSISERRGGPLDIAVDPDAGSTSDFEDLVIGTKIRLAGESGRRPAFGVRLATRLPNAGNESGLGSDAIEFHGAVLVAKTIESIRVVGNVGLVVADDPLEGTRQNDFFAFGLSVARAVTAATEVVAEVNGRRVFFEEMLPPSAQPQGGLRVGARYTRGGVRFDGGLTVGLADQTPAFGLTAGVTWVLDAFRIP